MPSKKKKYNARFPAGRIKKIMQSDEEIGKVAQAVPIIISKTLELFVESLLHKSLTITNNRNAKTLSTSHMKQCIMAEQRFDFLRELVKNIPDINIAEESLIYNEEEAESSPEEPSYPDSDTPYDLSINSSSTQARLFAANGDQQKSQILHTCSANGSNSMIASSIQLPYISERRVSNSSVVSNIMMSAVCAPAYEKNLSKNKLRSDEVSNAVLQDSIKTTQGTVSARARDDKLETNVTKNTLATARTPVSVHEDKKYHLESDKIFKKHLQQKKISENIQLSKASVIKHTTVFANTQTCPSFSRCSTDLAQMTAAYSWSRMHQEIQSTPKEVNLDHQRRQLCKRQSQSLADTTDTIHNKFFSPVESSIPSNLLTTDCYKKNITEARYSNLSIPENMSILNNELMTSAKMPASAGDLNITSEPIFNIDLSNIGTSSDSKMGIHSTIAKITMGNSLPIPLVCNSSVAEAVNVQTITQINTNYSSNSSSTPEQQPREISSSNASHSLKEKFQLDEDYDNI